MSLTIPPDGTQVVRAGVERACQALSDRIAPAGFRRTRKMLWTRRIEHTVHLLYLHRRGSTYGRPLDYSVQLRVQLALQVLNGGVAVLGPCSDHPRLSAHRFHLRFNAQSGSTFDRCLDDLTRYLAEEGEPWLARFTPEANLLVDSLLSADQKARLAAALEGRADPDVVAASCKGLGLT